MIINKDDKDSDKDIDDYNLPQFTEHIQRRKGTANNSVNSCHGSLPANRINCKYTKARKKIIPSNEDEDRENC